MKGSYETVLIMFNCLSDSGYKIFLHTSKIAQALTKFRQINIVLVKQLAYLIYLLSST